MYVPAAKSATGCACVVSDESKTTTVSVVVLTG